MTSSLLFWLFTKHFIADFPLQATPWMYRNKGTYGHPGGLAHAGIHAFLTFVVLVYWTDPLIACSVSTWEGTAHYHIDWAKMNLGTRWGLTPINSEWFWILLGVDQYLHALTYFFIAYTIGG